MHAPRLQESPVDETGRRTGKVSRRVLLASSAATGAASVMGAGQAAAQEDDQAPVPPRTQDAAGTGRGLLYPQRNELRDLIDLSGLWQFQLDPERQGEGQGWSSALPAARPIVVPCSWNDLFDDAKNYLGLAWYLNELWVPQGWQGKRVFLRVGSANYAAKVWVNGTLVAEHLGGHLPFVAEISPELAWDRPNVVAIAVENEQLPERVPPGPGPAGGGVAGVLGGFPATTYDFFPYAGLHRQVWLYAVPADAHIDDITVTTTIEGEDGVARVAVRASGGYAGRGQVRLDDVAGDLAFRDGVAEATLRIPGARLWSPQDPHLYPLRVTLGEGQRVADAYTLDIGIRTVAVEGDRLLLNGEPIKLTGFGKHEDFPLSGRGLNLPMWIRDYELLRWVGANSYRASHYPYAEEAMQLADRLGVLVINEIPAVGLNFEDPPELTAQRLEQCRQQLQELITRDKNHPSTIMWNVANEPLGGPPLGAAPPVPEAVASGMDFFRQLYDEVRRLDPTRPVTLVGVQGGVRDWHGIFDVVCVNGYYGWYTQAGQLELGRQALAQELDELHQTFGKPVMVTEFGADTLPGAHNQPPEMWTEEYQTEFLRGFLDVAAERPFMAGMHVWNFADFKTGQGTMRAAAMNFKGVFTREREPKMAAHFLRERWAT
ncbi:beta-glucuronidase [Geminicoccus harenae]|uniref:beta-glucuronidase n=1 Tax=Geminicoccus harenae TaxID=2498453 RepID=UPI00168B2566|nr:beta-glucuronidase [Geminicoccus harenae]